jgi:hypothetical protein
MNSEFLQLGAAAWLSIEVARRIPTVVEAARQRGFTLKPATVLWETKRANVLINKIGENAWFAPSDDNDGHGKVLVRNDGKLQLLLDVWFVTGILFFATAQLFMTVSLVTGAVTIIYRLLSAEPIAKIYSASTVRPVIPGRDLPLSQVPVFLVALILTLIFHELGHALAATSERVRTEGVGVFVTFFIPGAFVRLEEGLLPQLPPRAQLKVYTAGVWHNFVLASAALFISYSLPVALFPAFQHQASSTGRSGVTLDLSMHSPFMHLLSRPDDPLIFIDDVRISSPKMLADAITAIDARAKFATPLASLNVVTSTYGRSTLQNATAAVGEVVQLQGLCVPQNTAWASLEAGIDNGCFVVEFPDRQTKAAYHLECFRGSAIIEETRRFVKSFGHFHSNSDSPVVTCRRSSDCRSSEETSTIESGKCVRAIVPLGESLVTVHMGSGRSFAWRGHVLGDRLQTALNPAPYRIRRALSELLFSFVRWLLTFVFSESYSTACAGASIRWLIRLPPRLSIFLAVLHQVSLSIAFLNVLPIYGGFDGHLAAVQFIRIWLLSRPPAKGEPLSPRGRRAASKPPTFSSDSDASQALREEIHDWNAIHMRQGRISKVLLTSGTALFGLNVALGLLAAYH